MVIKKFFVILQSWRKNKRVMAEKMSSLWNFLSHYKYLIVVGVGVVIVGFLDENSFMKRMQYEMQISALKEEIAYYETLNEDQVKRLRELHGDSKAIEKIARERYFMKADDEDIYVFSEE